MSSSFSSCRVIANTRRNLGRELVNIYVGKKRTEFIIHKKLICDKTEFFLKAFTGAFRERDGVIHLPEEDSGSFALFVDWLYRFTVPHSNTREHFINLFKLYVFAEKLCVNELANQTIDQIRCTMSHNNKARITVPLTSYIYKNTFDDSPIRNWCIQNLAYELWERGHKSTIPGEGKLKLILDLNQSQSDLVMDYFAFLRTHPNSITRRETEPGKNCQFNLCEFHRHGPKERCYCYAATTTSDSHRWLKGQGMDDLQPISD
jgi:hypothetical protein